MINEGAERRTLAVLVVFVGLAALALRLNAGFGRDLWEDEIIAAVHAEFPLWQLPAEILRDVHPPLYFAQLHIWALVSDGDLWLRMNSLFWNVLAVASMVFVARRIYDLRTAVIASSLLAVAAPMVWMAQELRPYSFLYVLFIWLFYHVERMASLDPPRRTMLAVAALSLAIIYSHAIGFFAVFLFGLYELCQATTRSIRERRSPRPAIAASAIVFGACGVLALPLIASGLLRDANIASHASMIANLQAWTAAILLPRGETPGLVHAAEAGFLAVAVAGLARPDTRAMALCFLVIPLLLAAALSSLHLELFKLNIFSTIITPFLVILIGRLLAPMPWTLAASAAAGIAMLFVASSLTFFAKRPPTTGFREAGRIIQATARPGDLVYAPQPAMLWGLARYMGVQERAWQLRVAPVPNARWRRVYTALGSQIVTRFGLEPETQHLDIQGNPSIVTGNALPDDLASKAGRIVLVTYERNDLPDGFPPTQLGRLKLVATQAVGFLQIRRYE